ncbi:Coatomer subunit zeta-1 [Glycine max]|nr:Coatomer subunit zeta-1 [Glycine max]
MVQLVELTPLQRFTICYVIHQKTKRGACPSIKNILLLDSRGKACAISKTVKTNARTEAEITLLDNNIIVYKFVQDLHFFVTGGDDANEIILAFQNNVDKREALENLDLILLCLDEIVGGMILETNGPLIAEKATSHSMDADSPLH